MPTPERRESFFEKKEDFEVPKSLKKEGIEAVETAYKARVKDDKGQNLTQSPSNTAVAIQIPYNDAALQAKSKGSIKDSLTWLALFWLRVAKKAFHFGKKVVFGGGKSA